jgi:hypothetical protein
MPMKPVSGRMSVKSIRMSLNGVARGLNAKNLTKEERMILVTHQALLLDELRAVAKARRTTAVRPEPPSEKPQSGRLEAKPFN